MSDTELKRKLDAATCEGCKAKIITRAGPEGAIYHVGGWGEYKACTAKSAVLLQLFAEAVAAAEEAAVSEATEMFQAKLRKGNHEFMFGYKAQGALDRYVASRTAELQAELGARTSMTAHKKI